MQRLSDAADPRGGSVTGCPDFDYGPGQPNLYRMMRFKQDLVARHGIAEGFEIFRAKFGLPAHVVLREAVVESERSFAECSGLVFVETAPAGEPFVHPPMRVIGEGNQRPLAGTTRSQYVACFADARLRGRSALINVDGHTLLDAEDDESCRLDDELDWDAAIFHGDRHCAWYIEGADAGTPLEVDRAFSLLGAHTDFFGHWMYEYLPKYVAARLSGALPDVPVLIDSHMPPAHREALELVCGPSCAIIEVSAFRTVHARELWSAPTLSYMPLHEVRNQRFQWDVMAAAPARFEPVIRELQRRVGTAIGTAPVPSRHVFLGRKSFRHRRLVNADAIEDIARRAGFKIVHPEELPFSAQAALARDAAVIVAPEGSAVYLAFFARPGTALCVLSNPLTDSLGEYGGLFGALGIEVMAVSGPITHSNDHTPNDSDYRLDEHTFRETVEALIAGVERPPLRRREAESE